LIRAPLWLIGLLLLAAIFVGLYAYFTTPLPYGLGELIKTPGGANVAPTAVPTATAVAATARAGAGQPLVLGAASVAVSGVQRNQDLTARQGPPGAFTLLDVTLSNTGGQPLVPQASDFRLVDDRGRVYAVDTEATRSENAFAHRRNVFESTVPPGSQVATYLAFETPADASSFTLRVTTLGYGDLDLPRSP
jgi:hypothetical protein